MKGQVVVVRTRNAGVHVGATDQLVTGDGVLTLTDARRVWRWRGANTLHELAMHGASMTEWTRISEPVPTISVVGVIEVIPCSPEGAANLAQSRWLN